MHSPITSTTQFRDSGARTHAANACSTQIHGSNELRRALPQPECTLAPPVVAGAVLRGEQLSFLEFLHDSAAADYCALVLGDEGTAAAKMLRELRNATEFHYFGYWRAKPRGSKHEPGSGKLTASPSATKTLLKKYARRAYRGDTERRGVIFWQRTAWLVWNCYATLMAMRQRAETIKQQDIKRVACLPAKRAVRAERMRDFRARKRDEQGFKAAHYTTDEAKEAWRKQRSTKGEGQ